MSDNTESYQLTYFNYRGTAEPIRMMLKLAEVEFEDHRLEWDDTWYNEHKQNYRWGTLPSLKINGDKVISHHVPIARYLARKFKLIGSSDYEAARCDELVGAMQDFRDEGMKIFVEEDADKKEKLREKFFKEIAPKYLKNFEKEYQENEGSWLVGPNVTWADIYIAYSFDYLEGALGESVLFAEQYPGLFKLKEEVYSIPQIKDWIESRPVSNY